MAKPFRVDHQIGLLVSRYLFLQDSDRARELLEFSEKSVKAWRYSRLPMFPEIAFPEELYGGKWFDKSRRNTFPHGFDRAGNLVLIQWHNAVTYNLQEGYLEAAFINKFGKRFKVQVVRHIYRDAAGRVKRAINLAYNCGYDAKCVCGNSTGLTESTVRIGRMTACMEPQMESLSSRNMNVGSKHSNTPLMV
jgi:hypothetical protein